MENIGKKIIVVGVSASGKSTFARALSEKNHLPLILMDSIMWNPGWKYVGDEETARRLDTLSSGKEWIIEGYITKEARVFVFDRADTIVYLDYPRIMGVIRYLKRWWAHRKTPRPELQGSPDHFNWEFLKLIWRKGEAVSLDKFLADVQDQRKIVRLTSLKQTKSFLQNYAPHSYNPS